MSLIYIGINAVCPLSVWRSDIFICYLVLILKDNIEINPPIQWSANN